MYKPPGESLLQKYFFFIFKILHIQEIYIHSKLIVVKFTFVVVVVKLDT